MLERECDEIPEAAPGQRVLMGEEAIVGPHADLVTARHRLREQEARHLPRQTRSDRRGEEKPGMGALAGSGTLHGGRHANRPARLGERQHVVGPGTLVEVGGQEPAGLVREEWVDADDMAPLKVIENDLIRHGDKRLVGTLPTLDPRLLADAAHPLVPARGSVPFATSGGVGPEPRVDIVSAPKELTEQRHLLGGSPGSGRIREEGKQPDDGGGLQGG